METKIETRIRTYKIKIYKMDESTLVLGVAIIFLFGFFIGLSGHTANSTTYQTETQNSGLFTCLTAIQPSLPQYGANQNIRQINQTIEDSARYLHLLNQCFHI